MLALLPDTNYSDYHPFDYKNFYAQIDLDDLHDPEASPGILLQMQDRQRYFEGQMASTVSAEEMARKVRLFVSHFSTQSLTTCHVEPQCCEHVNRS